MGVTILFTPQNTFTGILIPIHKILLGDMSTKYQRFHKRCTKITRYNSSICTAKYVCSNFNPC
jgi:hypothetical protein